MRLEVSLIDGHEQMTQKTCVILITPESYWNSNVMDMWYLCSPQSLGEELRI